jgi:arylsulfatase A-like enzyme
MPAAVSAQAGKRPPNYLFIAIDDLNDWIGVLGGHPQASTPNMDRLAKRGVLFANAHTQAPLCNPSRASLLSGLRPSTTGLYTLLPGVREAPALKHKVMLPKYLEQHGYATFGVGKIYHDGSLKPEERSDEIQEWGTDGTPPFPPQKFVNTPDPMKVMDWGVFPEHDEDHGDWKIAEDAIGYLKKADPKKPFFLGVGFRSPHVPCFASQKWFDLYPPDGLIMPMVKADDRADVPEFSWYLHWKLPEPRLSWLQANQQWRPLVRSYLAAVSFMDSQVGRVLNALDETEFGRNTIVILWSDHGWHLGEKGITGKTSLWERSTRVPLIFAGPGIHAGGRSEQPVELLDLYPTMVELSGLPARSGLEGHSLVKLLSNPQVTWGWPAITTHNQNNHAVRSEHWRYIRYADGSEELYDHRSDPNEWTNVAHEKRYSNVVREHARWLPKKNLPPVPGSAVRLLVKQDGVWMWEGKPIRADEKEQ